MLANGFAIAGMFIFITKSSFIYIEYFKVDINYFTLFFSLNIVSLITFSKFNISLLQKYSSFTIFKIGIIIQLISASILILFAPIHTLESVIIFIMLYVGALGFIFANAISLLLENFGHISATTNALNGVIGFIVSAFIGFLASLSHNDTLQPIFILMGITSIISLFIVFILLNKSNS